MKTIASFSVLLYILINSISVSFSYAQCSEYDQLQYCYGGYSLSALPYRNDDGNSIVASWYRDSVTDGTNSNYEPSNYLKSLRLTVTSSDGERLETADFQHFYHNPSSPIHFTDEAIYIPCISGIDKPGDDLDFAKGFLLENDGSQSAGLAVLDENLKVMQLVKLAQAKASGDKIVDFLIHKTTGGFVGVFSITGEVAIQDSLYFDPSTYSNAVISVHFDSQFNVNHHKVLCASHHVIELQKLTGDKDHSLYLAGGYTDSMLLHDQSMLYTVDIQGQGTFFKDTRDVFISRLGFTGEPDWTYTFGTKFDDFIHSDNSLAADKNGVYLVFEPNTNIIEGPHNQIQLNSTDNGISLLMMDTTGLIKEAVTFQGAKNARFSKPLVYLFNQYDGQVGASVLFSRHGTMRTTNPKKEVYFLTDDTTDNLNFYSGLLNVKSSSWDVEVKYKNETRTNFMFYYFNNDKEVNALLENEHAAIESNIFDWRMTECVGYNWKSTHIIQFCPWRLTFTEKNKNNKFNSSSSLQLSAWPNPAQEKVEFASSLDGHKLQGHAIHIYTLTGIQKAVIYPKNNGNRFELNCANYPKGIYVAVPSWEEESVKFIVD